MKITTEQPSCKLDLQRVFTTICTIPISNGQFRLLKSNARVFVALLFFISGLMFTSQRLDAQCNSFGIDFKQGANRDGGYEPGQIHWIGSILQNSNSLYIEGMSTLQRIVMNNLPSCGDGYHSLRIKLQSRKGDNHAYDFITSWDNAFLAAAAIAPGFDIFPASRADAVNDLNECGDEIGACAATACGVATSGTFKDLPIIDGETNLLIEGPPADQNTLSQIIPIYESRYGDRTVRVYVGPEGFGGTAADNQVVFVGYGDANPNDGGDSYIYYDIMWVSTSPNVVIEFGAHIAVGVDGLAVAPSLGVGYLLNRGASSISGGPYHVIIEDFQPTTNNDPNCEPNLGNLDNQLQGSQVLLFPDCELQGPSSLCSNGTATYTATVTNPSAATYLWEIINTGSQSPAASIIGTPSGNVPAPIDPATTTPLSITVNTGGVGTYTVKLTITNGGQTNNDADDDISSTCTVTTTVNPGPAITCPPNRTEAACQSQTAIDAAFLAWLQLVTPTGASNSGGPAPNKCGGTATVIFTTTNTCGSATCSATFTVTADNTPPAFTGSYADVTLGCSPADPTGSLGSASATDNCGATTITSSDGAISSNGCNRSRTRTFTATDGCNNTATISRTVTWISDNTPPIITTGGTTTTLGCNPSAGDIDGALGTATATDVCGTPTEFGEGPLPPSSCISSYKGNNGGGNCPDLNGQPATGKVTLFFTSALTAAPTILSVTDNDPASDLSNVRFGPGVLSNDGLSAQYCYYDGPNNNNNLWGSGIILTFNLLFPNGQGCIVQAPQHRTPRSVGSQILATQIIALQRVTSLTSSDGPVTSNGCSRSQTRTWTAIDDCGNTSTAARTVTWISDITPPVITTGGPSTSLGCNPSAGDILAALGTATATDACSTPTVVSVDAPVQVNGCNRTQTRTFTARDACGNTSTASRTATWISDITPPVITTGGPSTSLGCNPSAGDILAALGTATATDACSTPTVVSVDAPVQVNGCNRTQTRTFTARDACGNTSTASRTATWISDITPPVITTGGPSTSLGCNPSAGDILAALGTATATDACSTPTVVSVDAPVQVDGCNRTQTRIFTARDACGNTSTASRTATWISDITPPVITTGGPSTSLGCNPSAGDILAALGTATATDACSTPTVVSVDAPVQVDGCNRTQTRIFTARDACGNTSTASRTATWISDITPPVITTGGPSTSLGCNPSAGDILAALGTATATDACSTPTVVSVDAPVQVDGCNRTQTRTFTARDACGNTSTASRTATWISDITPPVITTGGPSTSLGCNPSAGDILAALGTATATDACSTPTVVSVDAPVQVDGCNRTQTRTFTARDACGNTSTASRTATWISDITPPVITTGGPSTSLGCNPSAGDILAALGTATATDACSTPTVVSVDAPVQVDGCNRTQTRIFTARDACGNTSTASRTATWISDITPPVITTGGPSTSLGCNPSAGDILAALGTATATDACSTPTVVSVDAPVQVNGCNRTQTRTFTARDACGNTSTASRTATWISDITPPVITTGGPSTSLGCNPSAGDILAALGTATATDACSTPTVVSVDAPVQVDGCNRTQTRTFTARDACGNTSTASRTATWISDITPPVITTGGPSTSLGCNPSAGDILAALGTATATDACSTPTVVSVDAPVQVDGCNRTQTRIFTARDACGNTSTASRTATWISDITPPVITTGGPSTSLGCNPSAGDILAALGTATATDACSTPTVVSVDAPVQVDGCNRTQTRTFTARDACGNTSTASRTATWISDITPPVITTGGPSTSLGCNPSAGDILAALGTATATDACSTPTVVSVDAPVQVNGCNRTQTRIFTARDACGNTSTASRTATWISDITPPVITTGGPSTSLGCNPSAGDILAALGTATATDACSTPTVVSVDAPVQVDGCNRTQTRTFTARDACGNTSTASRTATWISDITPPVITTGGPSTSLGCNPSAGDILAALGTATATDACSTPTVVSVDAPVQVDGCNRTQTRTFTARDACGNTSTASRTATWISDITPPVITTGGPSTSLGCNPSAGDILAALGTATATDACSTPTVVSVDAPVQVDGCNRTQTRTFTARDACGNTSTASRTATWISDITPPVITTGGPSTSLGCNPSAGDILAALGTATATDACSTPTVVSVDAPVQVDGCNRTQTRIFTARDACGNTSTASRTATWISDITPPVITTGGPSTSLGCNPSAGDILAALGTATATDACSTPTVVSVDAPVQVDGCNRTQTRIFTARDACGNTSTASRTATWISDITPPVITTGGPSTSLGCNPSAGDILAALGTATATDACSTPTVVSVDAPVQVDGCNRTQTRTFTARDACGNTSTASRTATWISDITPPVITTGGPSTSLGCNPSAGDILAALGTATATDACSTPTVVSVDAPVQVDGCNRTQTRTFTARDACGNTSTASRTATWISDITPPVITTGGPSTSLGCNPSAGDILAALGTATATDACSTPTVVSVDAPVQVDGCNRTQTRTFTARDACGNTSTASRTATWISDITPPVITTGGPSTSLGCNPSAGDILAALGTATATDACSTPTVVSVDAPVQVDGCNRTQTRTFTARDACGNTSTASRTATWISDITPPVITTGGPSTSLGCNPSAGDILAALGTATATDACSTPTVVSVDAPVQVNGCNRTQTRTFTARDACGNTSTASRTATWISDITPPVITTGGPSTSLGCNPSAGDILAALGTATATDACSTPTVVSVDAPVQVDGCNRTQTRTFTARDACGNTSTASRTATWISDITPPVITTGGPSTSLGCNPSAGDILAALGTATATDACSTPTVVSVDAPVQVDGCNRTQTRIFTARDACGNTSTASRTATWISDITPPVITTGGPSTSLGCNPSAGDILAALGTATATDACSTPTVVSVDAPVQVDGCNRTQTRIFTARDACGNTSTASRTATWISDITPPVITTGGPSTSLGCNPSAGDILAALGTATATDACSTPTVVSVDAPVQVNGCNRTQTRTFTARDACGNTSTASRTATWISDITPPVITTGGPSTSLGCNPSAGDILAALGTATATDACSTPTVVSVDAPVQVDGCNRTQTRIFTARDACGNTSTASRTATWISDITPPVITTGGPSTSLGCNPSAGDILAALGTATATDACSTPTVVSVDAPVQVNGCNRTQTRTFTARDACGNTSTASRTATWISDITPPVITTGGPSTSLGCNPSAGDILAALGTATATDACSTPTVVSVDAPVQVNGCNRTQTRTFTARDACGNTSTASRTATWISDITPPVITTGGPSTSLGCNPSAGDILAALGTATATDACSTPTVVSVDAPVQVDGCNRTQTRIFTARDACGNSSTASRTITWISDITPPVITTGGTTTTLGCNPSASDINGALGTATATDACGTPTEIGGGPLPGSCIAGYKGNNGGGNCPDLNGQPGTGKVTLFFNSVLTAAPTILSVTDDDPTTDLSNVFFGPGELSNDGLSAEYCVYEGPNNNNNIWSGSVVLSFTLQFASGQGCVSRVAGSLSLTLTSSDGPVVSNGCSRSQTRTWIATDDCGNTATASRTATWISDITPPVITTGGPSTSLGCNPSAGDILAALGTATATDACSTPTVVSVDAPVQVNGCNRTQTRTFTARDACGNTSTASRTATWISDITPPVITTGGPSTSLGCNPSAGDILAALGTATATDACSTPTVVSVDAPVQVDGCNRTQTRTFTARDACGNTSTASRTATWISDITPPVITTGGPSTSLGCNPSAGDILAALGTATATDACSTPTVVSVDAPVQVNGCNRTQTRTFTARDACGNTSTASRTATWISDITPPVITTGGPSTSLGCNPSAGDILAALGTATATDACSTPTVVSVDAPVQVDGCNRTQTRIFTARDACGNTSTASRTATWISDITPPVITTGGPSTSLGCNPSAGDILAALGTATATDACSTPTVVSVDAPVQVNGCNRTQTRIFTARDACGNTSTASRTATWISDITPPVITTGGPSTSLGCNPSAGDILAALGTATATDACSTPTVVSVDAPVQVDGCNRTQTRTFTARDACGNTSTASRTATWISDITPPVITTGGPSTSLGCNPSAGDILAALGTATATDACSTPTVVSVDAPVQVDGCNRTQTRIFTARDACGNTSTASRTATWISDITPPVITTGGPSTSLGCNPSAGDILAALGTATATDACSTPTVVSVDAPVQVNGCNRTQTRTFTARDACGNTSTASRTATWISDITPPVITTGGPSTSLGCNPSAGDILAALGTATATDACSTPTVVSVDAPVQVDGCNRTQTRTFTARDACGNTSTASRTATWISDITPPVITTGGPSTSLGCNPSAGDILAALGTATATDACSTPTVVSVDAPVQVDGCNRTQTRIFTARDACGNTSTASRTATWISDITPPVITTGGPSTSLGCNPSAGDILAALGTATATDACSTPTVVSVDAPVQVDGCNRTQTRIFTARDACGNTSTASRTATWISDITPPVITTGGPSTSLGCNPSAGDILAALGTATATDACSTPTVVSVDAPVQVNGCNRTQTRTFTARDACGNTSTASRTATWISDITPPVITTGGPSTSLGCNPSAGDILAALGTATATDACSTPTVVSVDAPVQVDGCNRTQTRIFTARDACGNTSTASRTATWISDITPPVITTGGPSTSLGCNPSAGDILAALGTATATDACSTPTVVSVDAPVQVDGCNRTQTRIFTARDACGNTSTASRTATWISDITPPVITTGGPSTSLGCNPSAGDILAALGTATATDACSTPTVVSVDAPVQVNGCNRTQTRTFTARDACGNTSTASRTATWISDITPPVITTGGPSTSLGCNPSAGDILAALGTATATDACSTPTVVSVDAPVQVDGCNRTQTRTFTARDACGNTSTASRTATWISDITPPVITTGGPSTSLGCNPSAGDILAALGTATATDACSTPTVVSVDAPVQVDGCNRTQTRTFTARDACGNTSTASRTATWISDITPPVITTGGPSTSLGCNPSAGDILAALGTATATDACSTPTVVSVDAPVQVDGCNRTQTRIFTARDACGNTSTASRTATWISDITPPVITTGGPSTSLGCNPSAGDILAALGTATATDACSTPTVVSVDAPVQVNGCNRTQTRTFTARDACGNTSTASRTATWISDITPPVITTGGPSTSLGCNPSAGDILAALGTATATDACSTPTVVSVDAPVQVDGCNRTQTRIFTARDACGNTSTASRTATWISDITPPVITTGGPSTSLGCNPSAGDILAALGTATATDACSTPTVVSVDAPVQVNGCNRTQTRTFTARDACGNTSTASRTATWISDITPPVITTGGPSTSLGCNPSAGDILAALGTATATDACSTPTVVSVDAPVQVDGCNRTQTRIFTARDACGNTSTASRTATWISDITPPVITTGGPSTSLGCNPSAGDILAALGTATATDACSTPTVVSVDAPVQVNGCNRTQTRTFTARDACGNTSTASRTATWISDITPPVITTGGPSTSLGCNPSAGDILAALGTATATDACSTPTVVSVDAPVQVDGCNRTQTRTFTARDACGNTSTASRTATWISDITPPVITTGGPSTSLGCNPSAGDILAALGTATATDACSTPTVVSVDAPVQVDGCNRTQTRTFTARDACGNTSTASRTATWISDITPPVITTGGPSTSLGCNPSAGDILAALGTATATDACSTPTVVSVDAPVQVNGCNRTQTRTFTARDACGNTSTASRTATWISDITPPVITTGGPSTSLGCNPSAGDILAALGTATATDACSTPTVVSVDAPVQVDGCNRTQTRTFTARDACGNTSTASRTATWISDITPPVITTGGPSTSLGCNPSAGDILAALGTATATDACSTPTVVSVDAPVQVNGCNRTQTRIFTARDACGNTSTASRTATWISDITPPVITTGGPSTSLGCNPSAGDILAALGTATATDACSTPTVVSVDAPVQVDGCNRTQTRIFTARDACGNTSTASRTATWISDITPPVITTGGPSTSLGCNPSAGDILAALGTATATDACSTPTVVSVDGAPQVNGCNRTQTRTFTARDACGNSSTASRTVTWISDITPPVFTTTPASVDLDCSASVPSSVAPTASDACGTPTVTMTGTTDNPANCETGFNRIVTRTWTARDACGNTATYTQTIRVKCCVTVCTLTQGAYGNPGGNICLPNGTTVNQTQIMIDALTAAPGNMAVFGRQDLNRYWVVRLTDVNQGPNSNIFKMLPGGGPSAVFGLDNVAGVPEYSNGPSWPVVPLQTDGSIRNQLFSQTLTLYFNTTIAGSTLADVSLNGLAVIAPRNCGTSEPAGAGVPTQLVSPEISSYLATHGYAVTVAGLLKLANDALGGVDVSPLTLTQIQEAVSNINETFDECKILTGYVTSGSGSGRVVTSNSISSQPALIVTAFPNPYKENFSLKINSPVTGQALISFYTMSGVKIGEMKRDVVAMTDVWVPYSVPAAYRTRIVYTVSVGGSYNARGIVLSPN